MRPRVWPGALMNIGTGAISSMLRLVTVRRSLTPTSNAKPWSAVIAISDWS